MLTKNLPAMAKLAEYTPVGAKQANRENTPLKTTSSIPPAAYFIQGSGEYNSCR
ncbi:hypothetical protein DOY81_010227 [Sarcophaga bullata]|nr:hypothetical protein DOY81_010227 [Sarcophaga bullata]